MTVEIYHNPRCSKSRQTLALLEEKGITPVIIQYLKDVPSSDELKALLVKLGFNSARELMRTKEADYKDNNLKLEQDEDKLISAMINFPKLIERPIVVNGEKAALGRPPEQVLEIL
ncbi:arsenate reductase (glutaredoxin) [Catenovulum sp. SM1970]|uniref:arsenate reductase (glutaredoxin) n=1 Tax=Marinifaba aquimaris TaxID=2741323 RepID=UPI001571F4CE|nr:arsenate reductase (glutaredoxin) [Marinifaba aquimaris]NTS75970.1 arsenate reductase (glutaredoxin) [Marinifaba aquimaris]